MLVFYYYGFLRAAVNCVVPPADLGAVASLVRQDLISHSMIRGGGGWFGFVRTVGLIPQSVGYLFVWFSFFRYILVHVWRYIRDQIPV